MTNRADFGHRSVHKIAAVRLWTLQSPPTKHNKPKTYTRIRQTLAEIKYVGLMGIARRACLWVVATHTIVAFIHNQAHRQIDVTLSLFQSSFALLVIVVAPGVAAAMIWRGHAHRGATLLVFSMLASVIFGFVNHFMVDSSDQLAHISNDGWGKIFVISAYALIVTELSGIIAGMSLRRSSSR